MASPFGISMAVSTSQLDVNPRDNNLTLVCDEVGSEQVEF